MSNLRVEFVVGGRALPAVDGVDFQIEPGEVLGIVGESGCGKSVTALSILGLLSGTRARVRGRALFEGSDLIALPSRKLEDVRGRAVGMVFQDPMTSLNPMLTVGAQIGEVLRRHLDMDRREARTRAAELLARVRIPDAVRRLEDYPHQFSGGMRQRVMIAMAVACHPRLLIADEPTTALDATVQSEILDILEELRARDGMAMVLITHDMGVVARMADRVLVMYAGQVVETGPASEFFARPEHPYTEALFAALPQVERGDARSGRFFTIPGQPPELWAMPPGCRFAPRCPHAGLDDGCTSTAQELVQVRPGHWVRSAHPASYRSGGALPRVVPSGGGSESAAGAAPLLQVAGLVKDYRAGGGRTVRAVDRIDFAVGVGETLGLVGESGSGKSTAALCALQLIRPTAGSVLFEGEELTGSPEARLRPRRREMQLIFQDRYASLDPRMTVGDIVGEPLWVHRAGEATVRATRVREMLDLVGLAQSHLTRFPHELSGGQRQRVGIARALALNPKLVVCDEPVSSLDVSIQAQVLNLLKDLQDEMGLSYVFIAHDLAVVRSVSDRIAVMHGGRIVETGPAERIWHDPAHAHTRALLAAVPEVRPGVRAIEGA